jgi:hypothetical protein
MRCSDAVSAVVNDPTRGGACMRLLISAAAWAARAIYAVIKAVAPSRRKVVFLSRQSDEPSRDFRLLADALALRDPQLEIVMRCRMAIRG